MIRSTLLPFALACVVFWRTCYLVESASSRISLPNTQHRPHLDSIRGGASKAKDPTQQTAYRTLARAIQNRLADENTDEDALEKALASLSSAQQALKGLDGVAHEAYRRTHQEESVADTSVSGRARRSAARAGCAADALLAAELCELLEQPELLLIRDENSTLFGRRVVLNITQVKLTTNVNASVLVLYEPSYSGGAGLEHGGIEDLAQSPSRSTKRRGRLLIIVGDEVADDLPKTCAVLDMPPTAVALQTGLVANEMASVQGNLYRAAGRLVQVLEPTLLLHNETAIHFIGRSLGGGIASLAATILDGSLPLPHSRAKDSIRRKKKRSKQTEGSTDATPTKNETQLEGFGRGRSSAMVLGAPPCLSANVKAAFVKSIIYGDDVVCRTTQDSLDRLCSRTQRALKGGLLGRQMGWMTDAVSLTVSSLKNHAHGSEGEEARLVVPGQAYLIRPRRLGGISSMHEVGELKGGREALRAAVLWQLHDVLLSRSLWTHHQLDSYIQGLDRVQLRGFDDSSADQY